jgi:hypothetical protein
MTPLTQFRHLLCLLPLAAGLPACATITTGSNHTLSVMTEPAGAACNVVRDGKTVGVVNPTPGSVQLSKSIKDISVNCTRPGYGVGVSTAAGDLQPMTLGNILLGGVIGVAVDAASGALASYPDSIMVKLPPEGQTQEAPQRVASNTP